MVQGKKLFQEFLDTQTEGISRGLWVTSSWNVFPQDRWHDLSNYCILKHLTASQIQVECSTPTELTWPYLTFSAPHILILILPTCPEQNLWTVLGESVVKLSILYHTLAINWKEKFAFDRLLGTREQHLEHKTWRTVVFTDYLLFDHNKPGHLYPL